MIPLISKKISENKTKQKITLKYASLYYETYALIYSGKKG